MFHIFPRFLHPKSPGLVQDHRLRLFGGRHFASANGPNKLIGNHDLVPILAVAETVRKNAPETLSLKMLLFQRYIPRSNKHGMAFSLYCQIKIKPDQIVSNYWIC